MATSLTQRHYINIAGWFTIWAEITHSRSNSQNGTKKKHKQKKTH